MILSTQVESFGTLNLPNFTRVTDPGRIAAQIVSGIGFLGAGVILKEGLSIRGLTTAACLWVSAAIGMASGVGFYSIAVFTTILALFALVVLRYYENFYRKDVYRTLTVSVSNDVNIDKIISTVQMEDVKVNSYSIKRNYEDGVTVLEMSLCLFCKGESEYLSCIIMSSLESAFKMKSAYWLKP
jgi:putative Mg2+ transporter-C (MgtC) family protein